MFPVFVKMVFRVAVYRRSFQLNVALLRNSERKHPSQSVKIPSISQTIENVTIVTEQRILDFTAVILNSS